MNHFNARLWPLVLALLGGCFTQSGDDGGYQPGWGQGVGGEGGPASFGCEQDSDCGSSNVCARDGECLPQSEVRTIHVTWTLSGVAASTASCTNAASLDITFYDNRQQDAFGFAPVPCDEGKFTVDKLPTSYGSVGLERDGDYNGGAMGTFDGSGDASLDLPY